ncbi:cell division protein FtsI [Nocardiopsis sp. CNT-189]|uniref:penicillin-binding transpeptidase domain-containing protein n=1 Tax=Nocardiopsis oceanisediminis TaxID=2816862 RepID=UPI003B37C97A
MSPRHFRRIIAAGTGVIAAAALAGCTSQPRPDVAVRTFLLDWQAGDYAAAAAFTDGDPDEVATALKEAHDQLDLAGVRFGLGALEQDGDTAVSEFEAQADLGIGDPVWKYTGRMELRRGGDGWRVVWDPSVIHPDLGAGERLAVSYDVPDRGGLHDRTGRALVGEDAVTAFGVVPSGLEDAEKNITALAELLDEDPDPLMDRVRSAPPEEFQPLVLLRKKDVRSGVMAKAKAIPGVETRSLAMPLTPETARSVVGEVAGTAEHNVSSRVASAYQAGDTVGLSGLQNVFQHRLAGTATTEVVTLGEDGKQTGVLKEWPGTPSGSVTTTLDAEAQQAAETALQSMPGRGHLVAVDSRTGEVLASASRPNAFDNTGAFTEEYRPGGAFGIVSAAAALQTGAVSGAGAQLACEPGVEVGGTEFGNENETGQWTQPQDLTTAFATGCTSALAGLGGKTGEEGLAEAAEQFGIGGDWQLSLPTYSGELSATGEAGTAAGMAGTGGVTVSPLSMALVAGAVADGTWHAPRLAVDADDDIAEKPGEDRELDAGTVKELRTLMRATVERGQATPANIGTVPVHGQVAQAEQKIGGKKTAVQWFVGYQGHIAFAAVAEVPADQVWDQYALLSGTGFLQGLPVGHVEAEYEAPVLGGGKDGEDAAQGGEGAAGAGADGADQAGQEGAAQPPMGG